MNLYVFEDQRFSDFFPISSTRAVFDIRFGQSTFLERIIKIFPEHSVSLIVRDEFKELVLSSGAEISNEDFSKQAKPTSGLFITKGKAERIKDSLEKTESELVIFNHDLTPSQERNLENIFQARVLDRTGLILDIFAERASSHIGKLQVELA